MSPDAYAVRLGADRGLIEFRHMLVSVPEMTWTVLINIAFITVLFFQRDSRIEGTSLAALTLPSILGMLVAQGGFMGVAGKLATDREDGTLLRARAVPNGVFGYLVSQLTLATIVTVFNIAIIFIAGLLLLDGVAPDGVGDWLTLLWVIALGLLATVPLGAIAGGLVKSAASSFGLTFLSISVLIAISGIFYPITGLPGWLQGIGQVFPIYWLGLGMRSALLDDAAAAAELGGGWRTVETAVVLAVWAVVGMFLALGVLRRMARGESGSVVEARRERALQRGY
ncbi:ABC transporter permease [Mangrovihabitans endophyticus]|uniref:Transport permease protein n=1 Tax=Mangrovihabitans endophyticus TaxID=1751298 RepID=A0A8J3BW20_9ACTN|nr:ABC transporter permease [Mangrovihabitans endophyticus]GGK78584.1 transport permease protein [Mangrovihabitans endophyticus]